MYVIIYDDPADREPAPGWAGRTWCVVNGFFGHNDPLVYEAIEDCAFEFLDLRDHHKGKAEDLQVYRLVAVEDEELEEALAAIRKEWQEGVTI